VELYPLESYKVVEMGSDISKDSTPENEGKKEGEKEHLHILPHHIHVPHVFHKSNDEKEREAKGERNKSQPKTITTTTTNNVKVERNSGTKERNSPSSRESPKSPSSESQNADKKTSRGRDTYKF